MIVLSKSLGRGDRDELSANYTTIVLGLSVLVVILAAAMIVFRHPIVSLLGADEAVDYEQDGVMVVVFFALGMIPLSLKNLLCILFYAEVCIRTGQKGTDLSVWDSGEIFDATDVDNEVVSFLDYITARILSLQHERKHMVATSFNKNFFHFD